MIKVSIVLIAKFIDQKDFVLNVVAITRKVGEFKVISLLMAPGLHTMKLSEASRVEWVISKNPYLGKIIKISLYYFYGIVKTIT